MFFTRNCNLATKVFVTPAASKKETKSIPQIQLICTLNGPLTAKKSGWEGNVRI